MSSDLSKIENLLQRYFDGIYSGETAVLGEVFHPSAHYSCVSSGELTQLNMPAYFNLVLNRSSPSSKNEVRKDNIISIEFAGPVTALAKVNCLISPKYFTDMLSLIKLQGRWLIISKVFHYQIITENK